MVYRVAAKGPRAYPNGKDPGMRDESPNLDLGFLGFRVYYGFRL